MARLMEMLFRRARAQGTGMRSPLPAFLPSRLSSQLPGQGVISTLLPDRVMAAATPASLSATRLRANRGSGVRPQLVPSPLRPLTAKTPPGAARRHLKIMAESFSFSGSPRIKPGEPLPADYEAQDPYKLLPPRRAGVLLHPTSLPGPHGIGDFGAGAFKFVDWLADGGCTLWQVLPLVPPGRKSGEDGSPYAGQDANCGNTLLLSLDLLVDDGLLSAADLPSPVPVARIDYVKVAELKDALIAKAAKALVASDGPLKKEFEAFKNEKVISAWLPEAALFAAIDKEQGTEFWWQWPEDLRDRNPEVLEEERLKHNDFIEEFMAEQFLFQRQWQALHRYANSKGIRIIGDMPIYVGGHSADVWANRTQFMLDDKGVPSFVSGVPPDAFSATGQLWGSPLYNWQAMEADGFKWWASRMRRAFDLYDEFRIDHFRGLAGYWSIPAGSKTAMDGTWMMGPRKKFFDAIRRAVGKNIDIIAEDLGVITVDVVELRNQIQAPGMAVLQFAFGSDSLNPHLPHNHEQNQVVYPGTHDNDTVVGWWQKAPDWEKENVRKYLHFKDDSDVHWQFIRAAVESVARNTIIPLQDIMGLDNSARMNIPAVQAGNWGWRLGEAAMLDRLSAEAEKLKDLLQQYNRLPRS